MQLRELTAKLMFLFRRIQGKSRELGLEETELLFRIQPLTHQCLDLCLISQCGGLISVVLNRGDETARAQWFDFVYQMRRGFGLFALQRYLTINLAKLCLQHCDSGMQVLGLCPRLRRPVGKGGQHLGFLRVQLPADGSVGVTHPDADRIAGKFSQWLPRDYGRAFAHQHAGNGAAARR